MIILLYSLDKENRQKEQENFCTGFNEILSTKMGFFNYFIVFVLISSSFAKKYKDEEKPAWAKKDIRDYSEADLER